MTLNEFTRLLIRIEKGENVAFDFGLHDFVRYLLKYHDPRTGSSAMERLSRVSETEYPHE